MKNNENIGTTTKNESEEITQDMGDLKTSSKDVIKLPRYFRQDLIKAIEYDNIDLIKKIVEDKKLLNYLCRGHAEDDWNVFHFCAAWGQNENNIKIFRLIYQNLDIKLLKNLLEEKTEYDKQTPFELAYYHRNIQFCREGEKLGLFNIIGYMSNNNILEKRLEVIHEAIYECNYNKIKSYFSLINLDFLQTVNMWGETILGNALYQSDKAILEIIINKFQHIEKKSLKLESPEYESIKGGLSGMTLSMAYAKEFLGHFYDNIDDCGWF